MFHRRDSAFSACLRWAAFIVIHSALCSRGFPQDKPPKAAPSQAASQPASQTVARILGSWKVREDRTKTVHCVWSTDESIPTKPGGRPEAVSKSECWLGRDIQYRFEKTTERPAGEKGLKETFHQWTAFDGRAYSSLKWADRSKLPRRGRIMNFGRRLGVLDPELLPLVWVYRRRGPL
jgi:hypothetical protein